MLIKACSYWQFRPRGLQRASHKLLTLADGWLKNDQLCISKNQKMQREAQFGQVKNAFEATHSDSRAKITTFVLLTNSCKSSKMHCNFPSKWIMRSLKKQAWCELASKSKAKINTFLVMSNWWKSLKMHCIFPSRWIMRSPKKQVWCKLAPKWQRKNNYKMCVILHICSTCQENYVFQI